MSSVSNERGFSKPTNWKKPPEDQTYHPAKITSPSLKATEAIQTTYALAQQRHSFDKLQQEYMPTTPQLIFDKRVEEYGPRRPLVTASGSKCAGTYGRVEKLVKMNRTVFKIQLPGIHQEDHRAPYIKTAVDESQLHEYLQDSGVPHLPQLYDCFNLKGDAYVMVMEDVGPTLHETFLDKKNPKIQKATLDDIELFGVRALKTLAAMHKLRYGHYDLKPKNYSASGYTLDLGFCEHQDSENLQNEIKQTLWYRAPEVELGLDFDFKADIWSLGCVLYELYTGSSLFSVAEDDNEEINMLWSYFNRLGLNLDELPDNIMDMFDEMESPTKDKLIEIREENPKLKMGTIQPLRSFVEALVAHRDFKHKTKFEPASERFEQFVELLTWMLKFDPKERVSAEEALRFPFFASDSSTYVSFQIKTATPTDTLPKTTRPIPTYPQKGQKPPKLDSKKEEVWIVGSNGDPLVSDKLINLDPHAQFYIPRSENPCRVDLFDSQNSVMKSCTQQIENGMILDLREKSPIPNQQPEESKEE